MNILIIVAHPDDEVLGMGGTIAKYASNGDNISIVYLTTGITSRRNPGYSTKSSYEISVEDQKLMDKEIKKLKVDALKSNKILGITNSIFYDFPDNELDSIPLLKLVKVIENEIKKFNPDIVYTNHFGDLNIDHRITYDATLTACRPINNKIKKLISFEVPSSTEWNYPHSFNPNYFINIEKEIDSKIKSFKMFKSEIRNFPHPRSSLNLKIIAQRWGSVSGFKFAEAFELIRQVDA